VSHCLTQLHLRDENNDSGPILLTLAKSVNYDLSPIPKVIPLSQFLEGQTPLNLLYLLLILFNRSNLLFSDQTSVDQVELVDPTDLSGQVLVLLDVVDRVAVLFAEGVEI
jgi:hypothetical protein